MRNRTMHAHLPALSDSAVCPVHGMADAESIVGETVYDAGRSVKLPVASDVPYFEGQLPHIRKRDLYYRLIEVCQLVDGVVTMFDDEVITLLCSAMD